MSEHLTADDLRMGDFVRLNSGDVIEVDSIAAKIYDAEGEHVGPFVTAKGRYGDRIRVSDVAEIVERNERVCSICETEGVTSTNPDVDFCRNCHYTGAAEERRRGEQLFRFRLAFPDADVGIEHTGGGCFWLSIRFGDSHDYYVLTDGEASLPDVDPAEGGGWRYVGLHNDDEGSPHYNGTPLRFIEDEDPDVALSDAEAIRDVRRDLKGHRPFPGRGTTRLTPNTKPFDQAASYRFHIPKDLARRIGPDVLFRIEVTDDGILFRPIEGEAAGRPDEPGWLR